MYLFDLEYPYSEEAIQWGMFNQNPQHTGHLEMESGNDAFDDTLPVSITHFNYPNPFNPETIISFQLSADIDKEEVELLIYNIKGQEVRNLSSSLCHTEFIEVRGERKYELTWDGTDNHNDPVSSGIYFYMLKTANSVKTRKMLLLK